MSEENTKKNMFIAITDFDELESHGFCNIETENENENYFFPTKYDGLYLNRKLDFVVIKKRTMYFYEASEFVNTPSWTVSRLDEPALVKRYHTNDQYRLGWVSSQIENYPVYFEEIISLEEVLSIINGKATIKSIEAVDANEIEINENPPDKFSISEFTNYFRSSDDFFDYIEYKRWIAENSENHFT